MKEIKIQSTQLKEIYSAIGEEEGLQNFLNSFYKKMSTDVLIGFFFDGKDLIAIASKQKEFLMRAWGITQSYTGKSPAQAHEKLAKILSGHFDRRLRILEESLKEHQIADDIIKLWVEFEGRFRDAIVQRE